MGAGGWWRPESPTPCGGATGSGPTWPRGEGTSVPSSDSPLVSMVVSRKIGPWLFVSSNSENIFLITFLKPKTADNMQLALWHLVNSLVQENA